MTIEPKKVSGVFQIHCKCGTKFYVPTLDNPVSCFSCYRVYKITVEVME